MTDSSTGGYLSPATQPAPLEGKALLTFLGQWIVGISGLPGNMVRPGWQSESPNIPDAGQVWADFTITERKSDQYPYVNHLSGTNGSDQLQRHETLYIEVSFYDLGSTGQADFYAAQFRDGTAIAQNREALTLAGMGLVKASDLTTVPVIVKTRWLYRVNVEVIIRREIDRTYNILNLLTMLGNLYTDTGLPPQS